MDVKVVRRGTVSFTHLGISAILEPRSQIRHSPGTSQSFVGSSSAGTSLSGTRPFESGHLEASSTIDYPAYSETSSLANSYKGPQSVCHRFSSLLGHPTAPDAAALDWGAQIAGVPACQLPHVEPLDRGINIRPGLKEG